MRSPNALFAPRAVWLTPVWLTPVWPLRCLAHALSGLFIRGHVHRGRQESLVSKGNQGTRESGALFRARDWHGFGGEEGKELCTAIPDTLTGTVDQQHAVSITSHSIESWCLKCDGG